VYLWVSGMPFAAVALVATAGCASRTVAPPVIASRLVPSVVVGHLEHHPKAAIATPIREALYETPPIPLEPKTEHSPTREEPPPPAMPRATLPDEVVLRLIEGGRAGFVRCFKQAFAADATTTSFKVRVRVELDAAGTITSAPADPANPELAACLTRATGRLRFPSSEAPVAVELPLFYQVQ
jgi:hypothetical protein